MAEYAMPGVDRHWPRRSEVRSPVPGWTDAGFIPVCRPGVDQHDVQIFGFSGFDHARDGAGRGPAHVSGLFWPSCRCLFLGRGRGLMRDGNIRTVLSYPIVMGSGCVRFRIVAFIMWPWWKFGDALELHRLRRALPSVHRRLVSTHQGTRRESDGEYLDRLRAVHRERFADQE
jgi:hypothetical protein